MVVGQFRPGVGVEAARVVQGEDADRAVQVTGVVVGGPAVLGVVPGPGRARVPAAVLLPGPQGDQGGRGVLAPAGGDEHLAAVGGDRGPGPGAEPGDGGGHRVGRRGQVGGLRGAGARARGGARSGGVPAVVGGGLPAVPVDGDESGPGDGEDGGGDRDRRSPTASRNGEAAGGGGHGLRCWDARGARQEERQSLRRSSQTSVHGRGTQPPLAPVSPYKSPSWRTDVRLPGRFVAPPRTAGRPGPSGPAARRGPAGRRPTRRSTRRATERARRDARRAGDTPTRPEEASRRRPRTCRVSAPRRGRRAADATPAPAKSPGRRATWPCSQSASRPVNSAAVAEAASSGCGAPARTRSRRGTARAVPGGGVRPAARRRPASTTRGTRPPGGRRP